MNKAQFLSRFLNTPMSPIHDGNFTLQKPGKPAAVLLPIIEHDLELSVLFTLRARHLTHHGGQISFPGGKQELNDDSLMHTALRETQEEIGLAANQIEIVGSLPNYQTVSFFEVKPYVGFIRGPVELTIDRNEVDSTFEVPLSYLLNQRNHLIHWVYRNKVKYPVYFIPWQQHNIWGATAAFIRTLSTHVS